MTEDCLFAGSAVKISKPGAEVIVPGSALPHDAFCGEAIPDSAGLPHAATQILSADDHAEGLGDTVAGGLAFQGKNGSQPNH